MGFKCYWEELNFDGAFFRATGAGASQFGSGMQGESLPNITGYIQKSYNASCQSCYESISGITRKGVFKSSTTEWAYGGKDSGWSEQISTLHFKASDSNPIYKDGAEVAPKNYTIRIWKRIS